MSKHKTKTARKVNYFTLTANEPAPEVGSVIEHKDAIIVKKQTGDSVEVFYTDQNGKVMKEGNTQMSAVKNQDGANNIKIRKILTQDFNTDELDIEVPDLSVELKKDTTYKISAYIISQCDEGAYMGLTNGEKYMNFEIAERENKVAEWMKFVGDNIEYSHFLFIDEKGRASKIFDFSQSEDTVYRGDYGVVFCKIEGCIRVKKDMKLGIILKSEEGENVSKKIKKGSFLEIEELS